MSPGIWSWLSTISRLPSSTMYERREASLSLLPPPTAFLTSSKVVPWAGAWAVLGRGTVPCGVPCRPSVSVLTGTEASASCASAGAAAGLVATGAVGSTSGLAVSHSRPASARRLALSSTGKSSRPARWPSKNLRREAARTAFTLSAAFFCSALVRLVSSRMSFCTALR